MYVRVVLKIEPHIIYHFLQHISSVYLDLSSTNRILYIHLICIWSANVVCPKALNTARRNKYCLKNIVLKVFAVEPNVKTTFQSNLNILLFLENISIRFLSSRLRRNRDHRQNAHMLKREGTIQSTQNIY